MPKASAPMGDETLLVVVLGSSATSQVESTVVDRGTVLVYGIGGISVGGAGWRQHH